MNTRHERLVSQLLRVLLQTHINWTLIFCVSDEEPFARRGEKGDRASHRLGEGAHDWRQSGAFPTSWEPLADFHVSLVELCCDVTRDVHCHQMCSEARQDVPKLNLQNETHCVGKKKTARLAQSTNNHLKNTPLDH